jgi:hypothetical protein
MDFLSSSTITLFLLADFLIGKVLVKDRNSRVFIVGESRSWSLSWPVKAMISTKINRGMYAVYKQHLNCIL